MLLSISTTITPATDLGYLLHKHPGRLQSFEVSVGTVVQSARYAVGPAGVIAYNPHPGARAPADKIFALGQYVQPAIRGVVDDVDGPVEVFPPR